MSGPERRHAAAEARVPPSQVTNRPDGVRDFATNMNGALASKTLAAALLTRIRD